MMAVIRHARSRLPTQNVGFEEDPYAHLISKIPPLSDRIMDKTLGKLMLDG
jgi:hypothetical protein